MSGQYAETIKKPIDQILKDIERDFYLSAHEALDDGIVDTIIKNTPNSTSL